MKPIFPLLSMLWMAFATVAGYAQSTWSLSECLAHAQSQNLDIQQSKVGLELAESQLRASKMQRLPSINFSTNFGLNWGRAIDPSTNDFVNQRISFNSFNIDIGMPLYAGNRINANIRSEKASLTAARHDLTAQRVLQLNAVSEAYLSVLMAQEQIAAAQDAIALTTEQLNRTDRLILAGSLARNERFAVEAQLARDDQSLIAAANQLQLQLLQLKSLLNLPPDTHLSIEKMEIKVPDDEWLDRYTVLSIYEEGRHSSPQILAAEARKQQAEHGITVAKSSLLPSLTAFGGLNSNYSTSGKRIVGSTTTVINQDIIFMGQAATIGFEQEVPILENMPYFDQLESNFGQSLGVSLRIPIFNQGQNSSAVQQARLRSLQARIQYEQSKQSFAAQVQQSVAEAKAARASYRSAIAVLEAQRQAYENTQKRFDIGVSNTIDLVSANLSLSQAERELIQAKYQYVYQYSILEWLMTDLSQPVNFLE